MFTAKSLDVLPTKDEVLAISGLEFMQQVLAGKIAGPPIAAVMDYQLAHVEHGKVVFHSTPGFDHTNPLGTEIQATGTLDHAGRSTAVAHGEIRDKTGRLYATGSTTCIIMQIATP